MEPAVWAALGVAATGFAGYLGVRYTAAASKRASEYSAMLQAPENISAGYDRLNDDLWRSVADLRARVTVLETENREERSRYWASVGYARRLLLLLHTHAPQVTPPVPPDEIRRDVQVTGRRKDST